jgi:hypothetical protein
MTKIKIGFNERDFNKATKLHAAYKNSLKDITSEAKTLGVAVTEDELLLGGTAFTLVADKLVKSLDIKLPNINPTKFLQMTDYDLKGLSAASNRFEQVREFKYKPTKEHFNTYVAEDKVEEYLELKAYEDVLNEMLSKGLIKNLIAVQQATAGVFRADTNTMTFKVNLA